ncbi:hypothetical protein C8R47DRAFT_1316864 [Mycena vitilis]|nr:hypothetical protein C8R47DRAFT_1316864 [Mycena vitilis]
MSPLAPQELQKGADVVELTPIHDVLPPEILSKIFYATMLGTPWTRPHVKEAPLLLCRVCSLWRTIALASPELWDNLKLTFRDPTAVASIVQGALSWLALAKSRKLSVWIFFFHSISANPVLGIVAPLENQIAQLTLTSAPIGCLQSLLDFPPESFPVLRALSIETPPPYFSWARRDNRRSNVPLFLQLSELSVSAGGTAVNIQPMPINWAHLSILRIENARVTLSSLCPIIAQCTVLAGCHLAITESNTPQGPVDVEVTTLPRLSTLSLHLISAFDYFLGHFNFPALATAVLNPLRRTGPLALTALPSLAIPTLRCLAIHVPCDPDSLLALLSSVPNLHEFHFLYNRQTVRALTETPESVAPRLAFITCLLPYGDVASEGSDRLVEGREVAEMIMVRWSHPAPEVLRPREISVPSQRQVGWDAAMELLGEALTQGLVVRRRVANDLTFSSEYSNLTNARASLRGPTSTAVI